jgi:hypothetical protein
MGTWVFMWGITRPEREAEFCLYSCKSTVLGDVSLSKAKISKQRFVIVYTNNEGFIYRAPQALKARISTHRFFLPAVNLGL